jgi:hypothetical protein
MFTDNNDNEEAGPGNLNKQYGNRIKRVVWQNPEFQGLEDQTGPDQKGLGTHSNRKYASTRASRMGARKEQVNYRGRWIGETNKLIVGRHSISHQKTTTLTPWLHLICVKVEQSSTCCEQETTTTRYMITGCSRQWFPISEDASKAMAGFAE